MLGPNHLKRPPLSPKSYLLRGLPEATLWTYLHQDSALYQDVSAIWVPVYQQLSTMHWGHIPLSPCPI